MPRAVINSSSFAALKKKPRSIFKREAFYQLQVIRLHIGIAGLVKLEVRVKIRS